MDWEETIYLNLIIHLFDYKITLAICSRTSPTDLQVTFLTAVLFLKCLSQSTVTVQNQNTSQIPGSNDEFRFVGVAEEHSGSLGFTFSSENGLKV